MVHNDGQQQKDKNAGEIFQSVTTFEKECVSGADLTEMFLESKDQYCQVVESGKRGTRGVFREVAAYIGV